MKQYIKFSFICVPSYELYGTNIFLCENSIHYLTNKLFDEWGLPKTYVLCHCCLWWKKFNHLWLTLHQRYLFWVQL